MKISQTEPTLEIDTPSLPSPEKSSKNFKELMEETISFSQEEKMESFSFLAPFSKETKKEQMLPSHLRDLQEELPIDLSEEDDYLLSRLSNKEKDKKKEGSPRDEANALPPLFSSPYLAASSLSSLQNISVEPAQKEKPSEIFALMEKVGSEMIVMASEKSTKTTLILDQDAFGSTLLKDAEITIEEFSSAPKIFNVKITAGPEAITMVRTHVEEFLKLFQERKFGFSINRIDTQLSTAKPVFSRKESVGEDSSSDQQGSKRQ